MDKLILTGIEIFGRHGCHVEEQKRGQIFKVDIELNLSLEKAGKTDDISETVDYPQVLFDVEKIVGGTPRKLIETVAEEIAEILLENYPRVESLKVTVHKPNAPLPVKYAEASVEISRIKNSVLQNKKSETFVMFGVETTSNYGVDYILRKNGVNKNRPDWRIDGHRHYKGKSVSKALAQEVFLQRHNDAMKNKLDNDDNNGKTNA